MNYKRFCELVSENVANSKLYCSDCKHWKTPKRHQDEVSRFGGHSRVQWCSKWKCPMYEGNHCKELVPTRPAYNANKVKF